MNKQGRQCTYNVTLRGVLATIVAVEKQACNAHATDCHFWPIWLYSIFPHYVISGTIFVKSFEHDWLRLFYNICLKHFSFQEEMSEI
jgi:hypothetical protein